jgi:excisionase family DNA binding protein
LSRTVGQPAVKAKADLFLTPGEVAAIFRVDPKTVTRWAAAGRLPSIRTPGGHRRFRESDVNALMEGEGEA